jgi:hypothetical protein
VTTNSRYQFCDNLLRTVGTRSVTGYWERQVPVLWQLTENGRYPFCGNSLRTAGTRSVTGYWERQVPVLWQLTENGRYPLCDSLTRTAGSRSVTAYWERQVPILWQVTENGRYPFCDNLLRTLGTRSVTAYLARIHLGTTMHVLQQKDLCTVRNSWGDIHTKLINTVIYYPVITTVPRVYTVICIILKYVFTYFVFLLFFNNTKILFRAILDRTCYVQIQVRSAWSQ